MIKNLLKQIYAAIYTRMQALKLRNQILRTERFVAVELPEGFLLGTYQFSTHHTWKVMVQEDFEPLEKKIIVEHLDKIDSFVDIGAHVGYYTCLVGTKRNIPIFAFEPNPHNIQSLRKNIEINNVKAEVFNEALSDEVGTGDMMGDDASGTIVTSSMALQPLTKASVKINKLDSFNGRIPVTKSMFVKIDTEAAEYKVLMGGKNFIKTHRPKYLLVEIVKHWNGGINPHFDDTFDVFKELGYQMSKISEGSYFFTRID